MNKEIEIPEGYEARIEGNKVILERKESENERIRKDIVAAVEMYGDFTQNRKEEIYAYLEKQKEHLPIPNKFSGLKSLMLQYLQSAANRKNDTEIESDTDLFGRKILDYVWKYDGKQKEEKHVSKPKIYDSMDDLIADAMIEEISKSDMPDSAKHNRIYWINKHRQKPAEWSDSVAKEMFIKALERAVEQTKKGYELTDCDKHSWWEDFKAYSKIKLIEWSEKDEENFEWFDKFFRAESVIAGGKDIPQDKYLWFKSLHPQPKQEWSEEDDYMQEQAIRCVNNSGKLEVSTDEIEDWLKFLPDKYKKCNSCWKPNEEQVEALHAASSVGSLGSYVQDHLFSLYTDLQQLL